MVEERIRFADLVGDDGVEEAFVIVESGGTLGDLGVGVYVLEAGRRCCSSSSRRRGGWSSGWTW